MKKTMKRGVAMLFVIIMISSMLALPVSAKKKSDWKFEFTGQHVFTDTLTKWGKWRTVYFRFKGTGIDDTAVYSDSSRLQYRNLNVKWLPAGYWCYGDIQVRGTYGCTGSIFILVRGSDCKIGAIRIQ